jgi:hypothetical protein
VRNSSLVERLGVDNNRASSILPKLWIHSNMSGRRAFRQRRRCGVSHAGATGKANVGISNDKESEKLSRRKDKVS